MPDWLKIYHGLPHPLRMLAATARGYYLRWWRYGPETEQLVEDALDRETWGPERWKVWQEDRLAYVLHRAATKVPYYRAYWLQRRRHGDRRSWEILQNWPVLNKGTLRENPRAFVAEDSDIRQMFRESTSGTTGTPLSIYLKRETIRHWYALFEARLRRWHGVSMRDRWAIMGGQIVVPFGQVNPPFWVHNLGLNQLYLSTHHVSKHNAHWYLDALRRFNPTHMIVYPSSASVLAEAIIDQNLEVNKVKVIISNAEFLSEVNRKLISEAFHCPTRNTYGMAEMVAGASDCEADRMHIWPEVGIIEVFEYSEDLPVEKGKTGRLITTGILNPDMPLVRYEVGDTGKLDTSGLQCSCGRRLPVLSAIEGRLNDLVVTPDGRRVFWLNPVFYGLPIRRAQIVQESLECVRVRFVPAPDYGSQHGIFLVKRMHERVGDMEVVLEDVDHISPSANGKFLSVISQVCSVQQR